MAYNARADDICFALMHKLKHNCIGYQNEKVVIIGETYNAAFINFEHRTRYFDLFKNDVCCISFDANDSISFFLSAT